MSDNTVKTSNSDETCEDTGITMVDVLKEEEELEEDAAAVLGPGDDSTCTYDQGYMKRQALYACMTCCPAAGSVYGGVCLGCSFHCHEGHELVELYTKRNFRCDCGNSKFPSKSCKLTKEKSCENVENKYNQNFHGLYCTCARPYPDPEDASDDEMIQCCICEDWYHSKHLGVNESPSDEDYSEMICSACVSRLPFLLKYTSLEVTAVQKGDCDVAVDVTTIKKDVVPDTGADAHISTSEEEKKDLKLENSEHCSTSIEKCKIKKCVQKNEHKGALFLPDNWRQQLCTCDDCVSNYKCCGVSHLLDTEDTVCYYEGQGKAMHHHQHASVQREIDALSSLDRITRTEVVHEYNNLSISLREYLKKFADNGKVVRDADIREFFSELQAKKKSKTDNKFQYFCK